MASGTSSTELDIAEQVARVLRSNEETQTFVAEQRKLIAEETKFRAEAAKLGRDRVLAPWQNRGDLRRRHGGADWRHRSGREDLLPVIVTRHPRPSGSRREAPYPASASTTARGGGRFERSSRLTADEAATVPRLA